MYTNHPGLVLGFHGCDKSVAEKIFAGKEDLVESTNSYDWLGSGIYFWEQNPERALEYASLLKKQPERSKGRKIDTPTVVGAVLDLGNCLNLLEHRSLLLVKEAYLTLEKVFKESGNPLPENRNVKNDKDLLLRKLDRAVIESLHAARKAQDEKPFDSVRAMFPEGDSLYKGAGFRDHSHVQICIRNPNCIKGYFRVRKEDSKFPIP